MMQDMEYRAADSIVAPASPATALAAMPNDTPSAQTCVSVMQDMEYRAAESLVAVSLLGIASTAVANDTPSIQHKHNLV